MTNEQPQAGTTTGERVRLWVVTLTPLVVAGLSFAGVLMTR